MSTKKRNGKSQGKARLAPVNGSVRSGQWRVYRPKSPMRFDGNPYDGKYPDVCGWFWIKRGCAIRLFVRVQGLDAARWLCGQLNEAPNDQAHRPEK